MLYVFLSFSISLNRNLRHWFRWGGGGGNNLISAWRLELWIFNLSPVYTERYRWTSITPISLSHGADDDDDNYVSCQDDVFLSLFHHKSIQTSFYLFNIHFVKVIIKVSFQNF